MKYERPFEYRQVGANNILYRVSLSEGQAKLKNGTAKFEYYLKDHLGNVRVVFDDLGAIKQQTDYYPFGLSANTDPAGTTQATRNGNNRYHFVGKETQIGSGYVDFKNRFYDPSIGRFGSTDLLADSYAYNGVYNYAENRPVDGIDLDGLEFYRTTDKNGIVTIGAKVKFENSSAASQQRVAAIKSEIQNTFNTAIRSADQGYRGQIGFDSKATLSIEVVDKTSSAIAGIGGNGVAVATNNDFKDGKVSAKSAAQVGNTAVHELLHNAGLPHPTDNDNTVEDTKLNIGFKDGARTFSTTPTTAKNIFSNIMLYGIYFINGKNVNEVRKGKPENGNTLTPGQLKLIEENIKKGLVNGEASQN